MMFIGFIVVLYGLVYLYDFVGSFCWYCYNAAVLCVVVMLVCLLVS